tara:strand:- start:1000 stop:1350 length:351 start_codon:yes stop_codon:yes gene_type:complete
MAVYIWLVELINNTNIIIYCLKEFETFIINLRINPDNNEINNNIDNNQININYYLFTNLSNQRVLFQYEQSNISLIDVLEGNYNIIPINEYRENNPYENILDHMTWLNILGRIELV